MNIDLTTPACICCHKRSVISVTLQEYTRIQRGDFVQEVFPDKTPDERELIITGTHHDCWERMFAGDDD